MAGREIEMSIIPCVQCPDRFGLFQGVLGICALKQFAESVSGDTMLRIVDSLAQKEGISTEALVGDSGYVGVLLACPRDPNKDMSTGLISHSE